MEIFKNQHGRLTLANWYRLLGILGLFFSTTLFSWNAVGHRVIAQIAYDHLTPQAKQRFSAYNRLLNRKSRHYNFVDASVWLDKVRYSTDLPTEMHYIDLPFSRDKNCLLPKVRPINAVTALIQSESVLQSRQSTARQRAIALRIFLHVLGDLHQPLHAVTYVSSSYPTGDKGGNLIKLPMNPVAENLHAYWDRGAGALQPMSAKEIKKYAAILEARWPCIQEKEPKNFYQWAQETHQLARKEVYSCLKEDERVDLTPSYQRRATIISESQLALAGCRLANRLNKIDAATQAKPASMSKR